MVVTARALRRSHPIASKAADIRTAAVRKGNRYVLNGEKIYTTNGGIARVFTVMAVTDKAKGIKGISAFIIERGFPGFSVGKNELKMGMHGCTTAPLAFNDCEVPAENLLGPEGMGYVQALKTLTMGRVTIAARCCETRTTLAVASLTPEMLASSNRRCIVSTDMSITDRAGIL